MTINAYAIPGLKLDLKREKYSTLMIGEIASSVCGYFKVSVDDILTKTKGKRDMVYVRDWCIWLSLKYTNSTLEGIGDFFCGRDHTTIMYAREKVSYQLGKENAEFHDKFKRDYENLINILES